MSFDPGSFDPTSVNTHRDRIRIHLEFKFKNLPRKFVEELNGKILKILCLYFRET